tara:strand:- start:3107 stop:3694 length:588 start_codon:yes stop_codon:yes gene_type:complete
MVQNEAVEKINREYLTNNMDNVIRNKCVIVKKKDKKFYRKRILALTKNLLSTDETDVPSEIERYFKEYIGSCIDYFKTVDNNDLRQDEYRYMDEDKDEDKLTNGEYLEVEDSILDTDNCDTSSNNIDSLLIRKINVANTLDNFVIRNSSKKKVIIPKKKKVNLRDPSLKTKGTEKMGEKNNIDNIYEYDNKKTKK